MKQRRVALCWKSCYSRFKDWIACRTSSLAALINFGKWINQASIWSVSIFKMSLGYLRNRQDAVRLLCRRRRLKEQDEVWDHFCLRISTSQHLAGLSLQTPPFNHCAPKASSPEHTARSSFLSLYAQTSLPWFPKAVYINIVELPQRLCVGVETDKRPHLENGDAYR